MIDDRFRVYVEQLRDGHEKKISEKLSPEFLEIQEEDLAFKKEIKLTGKAYLAEQELILNWNIIAEAIIPCSICNDPVPIDIQVENFYHMEPLSNIKAGIFDFKELLRETILLEVPPFVECNQGNCPDRPKIKKYLKEGTKNETDQGDGYHPFADLDLK